jgi:hypothetical protein
MMLRKVLEADLSWVRSSLASSFLPVPTAGMFTCPTGTMAAVATVVGVVMCLLAWDAVPTVVGVAGVDVSGCCGAGAGAGGRT